MNDFEQELPTRPDHPATVARKCKHCGHVYGDHNTMFPSGDRACLGLRRKYEPEDQSDGDQTR